MPAAPSRTPAFCPTPALPTRTVLRRASLTRRSAPRAKAPPPSAKPIFYKNPSKAIEKGGGFYVPGLRGPRLRFAVASVVATLLTANHVVTAVAQPPHTLLTSEALAAAAVLAVFVTALRDSKRPAPDRTSAPSPPAPVVAPAAPVPPQRTGAESSVPTPPNSIWPIAVCTDLTPVTHVAHFTNGVLRSSTPNVASRVAPGTAVDRVLNESRSIYISDSSTLPAHVTLPFLAEGVWSVFLVPNEGGVVAFAKSGTDALSVDHRRWLAIFAKHYFL
ncbi:unnamed protein product [Agarophyton chilense]